MTYLTTNKFALNVLPPSTEFLKCQTTIQNALRLSPNESIKHLWKSTNNHTNIQHDQYKSTKDVIKSFHDNHEDKLKNNLPCQGSFFSSILKYSLSKVNTIWPTCQSKLPKDIFNFTIRYINNSLPNRENLHKWVITLSPECSFCLYPDRLILTKDNTLYVLELTFAYETNLRNNINRKFSKYKELIKELKRKFNCVKFINLSVSALGVFDNESTAFIDMLERLDVNKNHVTYYIKKIITTAIRSTYYIFCCSNKEWTKPNLIKF